MSIYRTTRFFESRFLQQAHEIYIEISLRINLCHVQAPGEMRLSAKNTPRTFQTLVCVRNTFRELSNAREFACHNQYMQSRRHRCVNFSRE
jgi:hypothetical protein